MRNRTPRISVPIPTRSSNHRPDFPSVLSLPWKARDEDGRLLTNRSRLRESTSQTLYWHLVNKSAALTEVRRIVTTRLRYILLGVVLGLTALGAVRPVFGQETGTLVLDLKTYTSDAKMPKDLSRNYPNQARTDNYRSEPVVSPLRRAKRTRGFGRDDDFR